MKVRLAAAGRSLHQATLAQLEARLGHCLPGGLLAKPGAGPHSRERIYSLPRTFWGWLWQMLNHNAPCREVVRQVQALSALQGGPAVDEDTGGYCQARARRPGPSCKVVPSRWRTVRAFGWPTRPPTRSNSLSPPIKSPAAASRS